MPPAALINKIRNESTHIRPRLSQLEIAPLLSIMALSLIDSLSKLTSSLQAATHALPDAANSDITPDGISLLDVKSELLVSYLQNLVFLVLLQLRSASEGREQDGAAVDGEEVVKKLVELRLHLEKGVRPLEGRIKYQIDKAIRAAETSARQSAPKKQAQPPKTVENGSEQSEEGESDDAEEMDELAFRPNLDAFAQRPETVSETKDIGNTNGVYRPPRITPTALPSQSFDDRRTASRKPQRSHVLDDYIDNELSHAPLAQPSIGSTIVAGGRYTKSDKERREEGERTAYEEANFTRLPPMSKKEKARKAARKPLGFGGEELRGIGDGLDRIHTLTSKKGTKERMTQDGPRGSGMGTSVARGAKRRKTVR